jgi:hypothetical protein
MAKYARLKNAAVALAAPAALTAAVALPSAAVQAQTPGADLRILSPRANDAVGAGTFALDVSFQSKSNSPVVTAELWVDGVRWVRRDLDTPQLKNVLSFDVDASSLTEGKHNFVVKVFTADGVVSETKIAVRAGSNEGVLEGSISGPDLSFLTPGNGKKVQGVVELTVEAKARNGQSPYVTFYVDKQFKTLKNYPPYTYTWDTTTVPNGYHTIEAMGYLDDANATTTRRIKVYVDNPGGATKVQNDVPDLKKAAAQPAATAASAIAKPLTIPLPKPEKTVKPVAKTATPAVAATTAPAKTAAPSISELPVATPAKVVTLDLNLNTNGPIGDTLPVAPRSLQPVGKSATRLPDPGIAVMPQRVLRATDITPAPLATPKTVKAAPSSAVMAPSGIAPVLPGPRVRMTAQAPVGSVKVPMVPRRDTKNTPKPFVKPALPTLPGMEPIAERPVQVAFDGQRIAFDVQPRVEAGLPIAPFRHIFEHTGGEVMWVSESRIVRAVNADREVVIGIGKDKAKVNGAQVTLDRAAFIEKGRTIVPLSFVGRALDVDVKYDAATGRIQITSKK